MIADFGFRIADLLANAGTLDPGTVGTIIGSVVLALVGGGFLGKKVSDSTRTTIDPQPLMVQMQDEFVSRREFDKLETQVAINAKESQGYFREATNEMRMAVAAMSEALAKQNEKLSGDIEKVASAAFDGRRRIHDKLNDQGEEIAVLKSNRAVGTELAAVGEKIVAAMKENQKPRSTR